MREESKMFFSEEKNQKTFNSLHASIAIANPLARLREREGPAAQRWEGEGSQLGKNRNLRSPSYLAEH